jgi:hypothetical protein
MDMYGGYGMGGGGSQSTMMMVSSISFVCLSIIAAAVFFFVANPFGGSDSSVDVAMAEVEPEDIDPTPVTADLSGSKLITVGGISMSVEGSSCGNGDIVFNQSQNQKWVWRLTKATEYKGIPCYVIESWYKNFGNACDKRFLTAPVGCSKGPYLAARQYGPQQLWMLVGNSESGFQIRNLACVRGRHDRTYLMQSSGTGADNPRPFFSSGSGSQFIVENEYGSG